MITARRNDESIAEALRPSNSPGPSLAAALEQQLGLRLEPITRRATSSSWNTSSGPDTPFGFQVRFGVMNKLRVAVLLVLAAAVALAADVTGKWTGQFSSPGGDMTITFNFKQTGTKLAGTVEGPGGELEIQGGKVDGDKITFTVSFNEMKIEHEGTVKGDEISLSVKMEGADTPGPMTLKRVK